MRSNEWTQHRHLQADHIFFYTSFGFLFGVFGDVRRAFCRIQLQVAGERRNGRKNFDFTRFGTRSHTPTKLTPFIYRRALNVNRDDDNEEEEDMEERTHKSTPM